MLDCPSGRHNSLNIGSLTNDDGDGNNNCKKGNRFGLAKKQLCTCSTLFCTLISFQSLDEYDVKLPKFMFCGGRENKTTTFFSFPEIRCSPLELSQLQKKWPTFDNINLLNEME